ncbi:transcription elongation factor B, polypeptide 1 [Trypanosoma theileri]|uniref:Transcription elongation factor B, polypeptide 1 n=1 Tax=Trypanosoma theileri TaxID=67003 RepID=A0A1X0NVU1_9TRYP|nr:transcription elongation factor B, polypeptide 1 [Trypanosoma theileri]ORC88658.1 transcription elongation factor B, polypeptide 1 [Trypanosoma theileri]
MIRSGAAFNPMRRTPPPPPYMDTFNLDPTEYIRVLSAEGHTFVVHRDCACSSPLLRKCLANRLDPALPTVRISWGDEVSTRKDSESTGESREAGGEEATTPKSVGNVGEQRGGDLRPPVIHFPELPAVWLEVVLQYLHHKHRYEGDTGDRPPFHVPVEGAIEVMKVAEVLQC